MSDYSVDSRVRNETNSLYKAGFKVDVFCLKGNGFHTNEIREGVNIFRFGVAGGMLIRYLTAWPIMLLKSLRKGYVCVHAHDITALPLSFIISRINNIPLIYDSHEYWSESIHSDYPKKIIQISNAMERILANRAEYVLTVSDSIGKELKKHFDNERVYIVRNIPSYVQNGEFDLFRSEYNIDKSAVIFLYQGLISESRGVNYILDAAIKLGRKNNYRFIFLGNGPYIPALKEKIASMSLEETIIIKDYVQQSDLLKYTNSADVGVHAIKNTCLNHDYCMPNKLFEYISSGLAVVVTNLKEMSDFVEKYQVGTTFKDGDVDDLADKLAELVENQQKLTFYRKMSKKARLVLTWENESKILLDVYQRAVS